MSKLSGKLSGFFGLGAIIAYGKREATFSQNCGQEGFQSNILGTCKKLVPKSIQGELFGDYHSQWVWLNQYAGASLASLAASQ